MSPVVGASTRWCPTPEQLLILEEMYRGGIKTPNATQIQQITAHLSLYGKIQGKNVFYWFQNHKARDRQKLRRKLMQQQQQQQQHLLQVQLQSSYRHHPYAYHLVNHCDASSSLDLQPFQCLPQQDQGGVLQEASNQAMVNTRKLVDTSHTTTDCMMMMMSPAPLCCSSSTSNMLRSSPRPPIRTLELFPIKSSGSGMKEEEEDCNTSNSSFF